MLFQLDPLPPFDAPRQARLRGLEAHLRRHSEGRIAVAAYRTLLAARGLEIPSSERTMQEDLRRYAAYCDDVQYGGYAKALQLNPFAARDAVAWVLGTLWRDAVPEAEWPSLSSSCLRCLLLAQHEQAAVRIAVGRPRRRGTPWRPPAVVTGVPVRFAPGPGTGYLYVRDHEQEHRIDLAQIAQYVDFTADINEKG